MKKLYSLVIFYLLSGCANGPMLAPPDTTPSPQKSHTEKQPEKKEAVTTEPAPPIKSAVDQKIELASELFEKKKFIESLTITYEFLPNLKEERQMGFERSKAPLETSIRQKIELYLLRARAYAAISKRVLSGNALRAAKLEWKHHKKDLLKQPGGDQLEAELLYREIEVLYWACTRQVEVPDSLSEREFLAYAQAHYGCAAPARGVMCSLLEKGSVTEHPQKEALSFYRMLAQEPLKLVKNLPPPARELTNRKQETFYKQEMKTLIEQTVEDYSKNFKNLPECEVYGVF